MPVIHSIKHPFGRWWIMTYLMIHLNLPHCSSNGVTYCDLREPKWCRLMTKRAGFRGREVREHNELPLWLHHVNRLPLWLKIKRFFVPSLQFVFVSHFISTMENKREEEGMYFFLIQICFLSIVEVYYVTALCCIHSV